MEPTETIAFIRRYNAWRRGDDSEQPQPYKIGQALDSLCNHAERLERELSAERALADRLAESIDRLSPWLGESSVIAHALAAWKEARRDA